MNNEQVYFIECMNCDYQDQIDYEPVQCPKCRSCDIGVDVE